MDQERLDRLEKKIDKITFYLESDAGTKQEGLVEKVNRLSREFNEMATREKVYLAKFGLLAFAGGGVLQIFWFILGQLFKNTKL